MIVHILSDGCPRPCIPRANRRHLVRIVAPAGGAAAARARASSVADDATDEALRGARHILVQCAA